MHLCISPDPLRWEIFPIRPLGWWCYPADADLQTLRRQYANVAYDQDRLVCGVIADYLTEHRSELLAGATGPTDPAIRLDALIDYLRQRFNSVYGG